MLLLEHHGKELLASHGIPVPAGVFVPAGAVYAGPSLTGPLMVKAQVASGGRGKAGLIQKASSMGEATHIMTMLGCADTDGRPIHGFRIEQRITSAQEAYVSLSIDAEAAAIRLTVSAQGGVDVEQSGGARSMVADAPTLYVASTLCADLPAVVRYALTDAVQRLVAVFDEQEATLLEINPLFVLRGQNWIAGDVKMVIDDNAIVRLPTIRALVERHPGIYPEAARKLAHGFDYVEIDPQGEIGLITTGAGLSMQLIDEFKRRGHRPLNFCDIRSGQFRGDAARLIAVMRWIAERPSVRVVLVNIFAGITDLAEFARLLVQAAAQVPELRVPIVARLIGRNLDDARQILRASALSVTLEPDLDRAVERTLAVLAGSPPRE